MRFSGLFSAAVLILCLAAGSAGAQEMKAMPAPKVAAPDFIGPQRPANIGNLVFLELFTAENCAFCPAAERNFNDILSGEDVIGVSCMVDYFDSGKPSRVSRPFCRAQQSIYARMMKTGSVYTPQLVINGIGQVPGHDLQKVSKAILKARELSRAPLPLVIHPGAEGGSFDIVLPALRTTAAPEAEKYVLRLMTIQKQPDISLVSEAMQRRERAPHNIATALVEGGLWDGLRTVWTVTPPSNSGGDSFIVMVQNRTTAAILAAGQYDLPAPE
jgi:hypothetical protein